MQQEEPPSKLNYASPGAIQEDRNTFLDWAGSFLLAMIALVLFGLGIGGVLVVFDWLGH